MKHCLRFLRLLAVTLIFSHAITFIPIQALDTPELIINEVKVRNDTLGFDEYIELLNTTDHDVSLRDYFISYINTPAPSPDQTFTKAVISGDLLPAGKSLVLAKNDTDQNLPNALKLPFTSLSDSGGTIKLTDKEDEVIDVIAWTSTQSLAILPILYIPNTTLTKSQSFDRQKDLLGDTVFVNPTWQLTTPTPESSQLILAPLPEPDPDTDSITEPQQPIDPINTPDTTITEPIVTVPDSTQETSTENLPPSSLPPLITELLPNPAAPASDSTDEFIELYNPNDQALGLSGYKLQSGNSFTYSHVLNTSIAGRTYKVFYVSETGNILSNTSGQARLLDPNGVVVAQTNPYDSANEGESWSLINGAWQWTSTTTPNAENILNIPILKLVTPKVTTPKKATAKATPKPKTTTAKVAGAKQGY